MKARWNSWPEWLRLIIVLIVAAILWIIISYTFAFASVSPAQAATPTAAPAANWPADWSQKKRLKWAIKYMGYGGQVIEDPEIVRDIGNVAGFGKCKEVDNPRRKRNIFGSTIWQLHMYVTECHGRNGKFTKLYPLMPRCKVAFFARVAGTYCGKIERIRDGINYGGKPQRAAWTAEYHIMFAPTGTGLELAEDVWCATTQMRAKSGLNHFRSGSCDLGSWNF